MKRILVVDDSQFNLMVVQKALENEYEVHTCLSGKEGIQFVRHNPIDLILMDIEMPEFSGIETVKMLKKDARLSRIPIIFLTGLCDHEVEKTCLGLGARDFITKPFNELVMLQRIKMVLELQEHLEEQALESNRDPVTGLWNRRRIERQIEQECQKRPAGALAVMNLDHFRLINDALGYQQGNHCLQVVGEAFKDLIREPELAAREAADIFMIYLPEVTSEAEAEQRIQTICLELEGRLEANKFHGLTLSAGIAMLPQGENSFGEGYYQAEKALHQMKLQSKKA
ncbi:diguanylate cyclase [Aminipila butyrica]|uniref:Stage 0 sporulation protein A homolog n=1 Tax=Aminipila butyrica TaxID=433296 RepID=A0A858BY89_9FIRM|nr:diguanylate cyclase [Aminipila butyrica]QIB70547.1 diguanylate cyclase [Aminipila butyrica]